jgi:hypothetical protein
MDTKNLDLTKSYIATFLMVWQNQDSGQIENN